MYEYGLAAYGQKLEWVELYTGDGMRPQAVEIPSTLYENSEFRGHLDNFRYHRAAEMVRNLLRQPHRMGAYRQVLQTLAGALEELAFGAYTHAAETIIAPRIMRHLPDTRIQIDRDESGHVVVFVNPHKSYSLSLIERTVALQFKRYDPSLTVEDVVVDHTTKIVVLYIW